MGIRVPLGMHQFMSKKVGDDHSLISPGWSKLFMPTRRANSAALDINLTISR